MYKRQDQRLALHLDNGTELRFIGRLFAGGSWYDEESGVLTRQKLYACLLYTSTRRSSAELPPESKVVMTWTALRVQRASSDAMGPSAVPPLKRCV